MSKSQISLFLTQEKTVRKKLLLSFQLTSETYIECGNLVWDGAVETKTELINRSVKRSIRTMMDMAKFDFVKSFYEYLKILPFKGNMKLFQEKFMWKLANVVHPNSITEKCPLPYSEAINNNQNKLIIPYCRSAINESSLAYTAYKLWNQEVPVDIISVKNN